MKASGQLQVVQLPYCNSQQVFAQVASEPWAIFLDSGVTAANRHVSRKHADYDVMAIRPEATLVFKAGEAEVNRLNANAPADNSSLDNNKSHSSDSASCERMAGDPIELLRQLLPDSASVDCTEYADSYLPGVLGYFSYDLGRYFEQLPDLAKDDEQLPELAAAYYPVVLVNDHRKQEARVMSIDPTGAHQATVAYWCDLLAAQAGELHEEPDGVSDREPGVDTWVAKGIEDNMSQASYLQRFNKVQAYIRAGDCYQVNLTKRFSAKVKGDGWDTYCALRNASPAPYGSYMNLGFAQILSNSPESFIQCRNRKVVTSPIKGTRPRDYRSKYKDRQSADQLINSTKDRAENLMIVDLMRNDLSRCCELGSVKVPKLFALHSFANVHHLISTITGVLKADLDALDLLRQCFPGGSITGAPKIRAMQIIEELEPHRRGLYCGSIGYLGINGDLETNITIRTMVFKDGVVRFSAGGGLVLDSLPDEEFQELNDKASVMRQMIRVTQSKP